MPHARAPPLTFKEHVDNIAVLHVEVISGSIVEDALPIEQEAGVWANRKEGG